MRINRYAIPIVGAIFLLMAVGCETPTNTNTSNANATNTNMAANNANENANGMSNSQSNENTKSVNANVTREEYEKTKDAVIKEAKSLGRTIGSGASDGWLWTKTRTELAAAEDLRDSTINVDVENAVVTLSGTVANAAQKARAAKIAESVEGVKSVQNKLTVKTNP